MNKGLTYVIESYKMPNTSIKRSIYDRNIPFLEKDVILKHDKIQKYGIRRRYNDFFQAECK